jgi:hypothetical protein
MPPRPAPAMILRAATRCTLPTSPLIRAQHAIIANPSPSFGVETRTHSPSGGFSVGSELLQSIKPQNLRYCLINRHDLPYATLPLPDYSQRRPSDQLSFRSARITRPGSLQRPPRRFNCRHAQTRRLCAASRSLARWTGGRPGKFAGPDSLGRNFSTRKSPANRTTPMRYKPILPGRLKSRLPERHSIRRS